jgi:hypothetical protein
MNCNILLTINCICIGSCTFELHSIVENLKKGDIKIHIMNSSLLIVGKFSPKNESKIWNFEKTNVEGFFCYKWK